MLGKDRMRKKRYMIIVCMHARLHLFFRNTHRSTSTEKQGCSFIWMLPLSSLWCLYVVRAGHKTEWLIMSLGGRDGERAPMSSYLVPSLPAHLSPHGSCPKCRCAPSSSVQGDISLFISFCPLIKLGHLYHSADSGEGSCWIRAWGILSQSSFPPLWLSTPLAKLTLLESASLRKGSPGPYH